MNRRIVRTLHLLLLTGLFISTAFAMASTVSHLSGSYQILQTADLGPQTYIRLQLRLANRGQADLRIQRITLWSFLSPGKSATNSCSLVIPTGASTSTTQLFTIPRSEYRSLTRGTPLRLLVAVEGPEGHKAIELVRLDPISRGKAN